MNLTLGISIVCRYCGKSDKETDIHLVARNGALEGFCLEHGEKLDVREKAPAFDQAKALEILRREVLFHFSNETITKRPEEFA